MMEKLISSGAVPERRLYQNKSSYEKVNDSTLKLTEFSDTKIASSISLTEGGLLYTSIPHANQWKAYVNGAETEIITIGGAMAAIRLEAGENNIEFKHNNISITIGIAVSTASLLVFVAIIFLERRRVKHTAEP